MQILRDAADLAPSARTTGETASALRALWSGDRALPSGQRIELDREGGIVRMVPGVRTAEVGDERFARVRAVLERADPYRAFARFPRL